MGVDRGGVTLTVLLQLSHLYLTVLVAVPFSLRNPWVIKSAKVLVSSVVLLVNLGWSVKFPEASRASAGKTV